MSMGGQQQQEDGIVGTGGIPTRMPSITRKRYSSSFGNRYVGGESGRSTPASVRASTGAAGGVGGGDGKGKEQNAAGVSLFNWRFRYIHFMHVYLTLSLLGHLIVFPQYYYR